MKKLILAAAGLIAVAGMSTQANTISVGNVTVTPGVGFVDWSYQINVANSSVVAGESFLNINDFGLATVVAVTDLAGTWSFTQPLLGPNSPSLGVNNPAVEDAVFGFTASSDLTDGIYSITLRTLLPDLGGVTQWTSLDRVPASSTVNGGSLSAASGFIRSPQAAPPTTTPDGGATLGLLGLASVGIAGLRRKLAA